MAIEVLEISSGKITTFVSESTCKKAFDLDNRDLNMRLLTGPDRAFGNYRFRKENDRRRFPSKVELPDSRFEVVSSVGVSVYDSIEEVAALVCRHVQDIAILARKPVFNLGLLTIRRV